jgi:hypothetical protein
MTFPRDHILATIAHAKANLEATRERVLVDYVRTSRAVATLLRDPDFAEIRTLFVELAELEAMLPNRPPKPGDHRLRDELAALSHLLTSVNRYLMVVEDGGP